MAARPAVNLNPSPERWTVKPEGINIIPMSSSQAGKGLGRLDRPMLPLDCAIEVTSDRNGFCETPLAEEASDVTGNVLNIYSSCHVRGKLIVRWTECYAQLLS
jgi:hypothetical protein